MGGEFTDLGGVAGDYIAAYDTLGENWYTLDSGLDNMVYTLYHDGTNLYTGGDFTASGIQGMNHVAMWSNGAWSGFGSGADESVRAVGYDGGLLYIGGYFLDVGGKLSTFMGRWGINYTYLPIVER